METLFRLFLAAFMVLAGVMHFVKPKPFIRMVPKALPSPLLLVYVSGVFEVVLGLGLLFPQPMRTWAAWGLIALFLAVFPANVNMAINHISPGRKPVAPWMLWSRLPLQGVLIAWAWAFTG